MPRTTLLVATLTIAAHLVAYMGCRSSGVAAPAADAAASAMQARK